MPAKKSTALPEIATVGSVVDRSGLDSLARPDVASLCDAVEFRLDGMPEEAEAAVRAMRDCPVPCLLTVRAPEEGGLNALDSGRRLALYSQALPFASLVDIEIRHLPAFAGIVEAARRDGIAVVGSYHDFAGTPDAGRLAALAHEAAAGGADIVKVAATLRDSRDLFALAEFVENRGDRRVSAMGMGPLGRVSRILLATLGSALNYGWLDRPTVPGQWPAARLRELIRELADGS